MLIAPGSTARSFAWPLGPRALAALVGGFYVVSAPVFVYAGRRSAIEVRGLAAAVLAFSLPTLAARYLHRDVFDFDRLFAVAWVVLFVASPVTFALLLWSGRQAPSLRPAMLESTRPGVPFSLYSGQRSQD